MSDVIYNNDVLRNLMDYWESVIQLNPNMKDMTFTALLQNINETSLGRSYNNLQDLKKNISKALSQNYIFIVKIPVLRTIITRSSNYVFDTKNICNITYDELRTFLNESDNEKSNEFIIQNTSSSIKFQTKNITFVNYKIEELINRLRNMIHLNETMENTAVTQINLKLDEYYIFIIYLFTLDPLHDFGLGFRDKKKCSTYCRSENEKLKIIGDVIKLLKTKGFDKLLREWKELYNGLNDQTQINPNNREILQLFMLDTRQEKKSSDLERNMLFFIENKITKNNTQAYELYSETQEKIQNEVTKTRFISNNAITAMTHNEVLTIEDLHLSFNETIRTACKSYPASYYDGSQSEGICGNLKTCIDRDGGFEFGWYNIKFAYNANNYVQFFSKMILKNQNQVEVVCQVIEIKRVCNERQYTTEYIYPIISVDTLPKVTVDNELAGYYTPMSVTEDNNNFGKLVQQNATNSLPPTFDVINLVRKSLCDFGQYLNGVLLKGGYYKLLWCPNTFHPDISITPGVKNAYPFVSLHGDQPAAALNLWLLNCIPNNNVNDFSHTVYATSQIHSFVFGNKYGKITEVPVQTRKVRRRISGGKNKKYGGGLNLDIDFIYKMLYTFFNNCVLFKVHNEDIILFNNFCNTYFFQKEQELDPANLNTDFVDSFQQICDINNRIQNETPPPIQTNDLTFVSSDVSDVSNVSQSQTPIRIKQEQMSSDSPSSITDVINSPLQNNYNNVNNKLNMPKPLRLFDDPYQISSEEKTQGGRKKTHNKTKHKYNKKSKKRKSLFTRRRKYTK